MGSNVSHNPYIFNHGNKLYDDVDKEAIHCTYWRNVFRISDNENETFDEETKERVFEELTT